MLVDALGAVAAGSSNTYAIDRGDGTYQDTNGEVFTYPAQHTTCFDNALCVVFGGSFAESLALVGWVQNNENVEPPLTTVEGVTVGSVWADHLDDLNVPDRGYSTAQGTTSGGIDVVLFSAGDPFLAYDNDGNEIPTEPEPADVTVIRLSAGLIRAIPKKTTASTAGTKSVPASIAVRRA